MKEGIYWLPIASICFNCRHCVGSRGAVHGVAELKLMSLAASEHPCQQSTNGVGASFIPVVWLGGSAACAFNSLGCGLDWRMVRQRLHNFTLKSQSLILGTQHLTYI